MKEAYDRYFDIASEAVDMASAYVTQHFGSQSELVHKYGTQYGVKEDIECNEIYEAFLRRVTPEVAIYTEEGEQNLDSDLVWVIDPIDGTSNFRVGIPFFNTQIALLDHGEPVLGITAAPILGQKFTGQKGKGAFLNGKPLHVSAVPNLGLALVATEKGGTKEDRKQVGEFVPKLFDHVKSFRVLGSTGLEMAYVAAGKIDLFIGKGSCNLYDLAPGVVLIREAGGRVATLKGRDWALDDRNFVAGNEGLVTQILDLGIL